VSDPRGYHLLTATRDQYVWWMASDLAASDLLGFWSRLEVEVDRLAQAR
jgi:hypothetical protein